VIFFSVEIQSLSISIAFMAPVNSSDIIFVNIIDFNIAPKRNYSLISAFLCDICDLFCY